TDFCLSQFDAFFESRDTESIAPFFGQGSSHARGAVTVRIGLHHRCNFYSGADFFSDLMIVPAQRFEINEAKGRASFGSCEHLSSRWLLLSVNVRTPSRPVGRFSPESG